jgi:hypothetical protein
MLSTKKSLIGLLAVFLLIGCYTIVLPPVTEQVGYKEVPEESVYTRPGDIYNYYFNNPFYSDPWEMWRWGGYYDPYNRYYMWDPFWGGFYGMSFYSYGYYPYSYYPYGYYSYYYPYGYNPYYSFYSPYNIGLYYDYPYPGRVVENKKRDFVKRGETITQNSNAVPALGVTRSVVSSALNKSSTKTMDQTRNSQNTRTVTRSTSNATQGNSSNSIWIPIRSSSSGSTGSSSSTGQRTIIKSGGGSSSSSGGSSSGGGSSSAGSTSGGRTVIKKGGNY